MSKVKKPAEVAETAALSYIFGVTSGAAMGRIGRENLAKLLLPFAMTLKSVSSMEATDASGIYRLKGSVTETLPDGSPLAYAMVLTFNAGDIYKLIFSYLGSAAYIFYNSQNGSSKTTMLCSYVNSITDS